MRAGNGGQPVQSVALAAFCVVQALHDAYTLGAVVVSTPEERERANRVKTWAGIIGKTS